MTEDSTMTEGDEPESAPTKPDADAGEGGPDKDSAATATDHAGDPKNADLNAGALSQPTGPEPD
jgi:hypothetical protein